MQIYLHFGLGFSVHRRDGAWQPASFFYGIDHAWAIKTQAVCFSFPCLQTRNDKPSQRRAEMVVRPGIFGRRGTVVEMLAVLCITLFPLGTQGGVFQNDRRLSDRFAETGACRSLFR